MNFVFSFETLCPKLLTHVLINCVPRLFFCVLQIAELFITEKNCILYSLTPTRTTQHYTTQHTHFTCDTFTIASGLCVLESGLTVEPWSTVGVKRIVTGGKFPYNHSCQRFIVSSVNWRGWVDVLGNFIITRLSQNAVRIVCSSAPVSAS